MTKLLDKLLDCQGFQIPIEKIIWTYFLITRTLSQQYTEVSFPGSYIRHLEIEQYMPKQGMSQRINYGKYEEIFQTEMTENQTKTTALGQTF